MKGNWSVVNGAYQNSAVEHAGITLLPINVGFDFQPQTERFNVQARMLNPYGASGNRMGILYGYEDRGRWHRHLSGGRVRSRRYRPCELRNHHVRTRRHHDPDSASNRAVSWATRSVVRCHDRRDAQKLRRSTSSSMALPCSLTCPCPRLGAWDWSRTGRPAASTTCGSAIAPDFRRWRISTFHATRPHGGRCEALGMRRAERSTVERQP